MPTDLQVFQPTTATPFHWTLPANPSPGAAPYKPIVPLSERVPPREIAALLEDMEADRQADDFTSPQRSRRGPLRPPKVIAPSDRMSLGKGLTVGSSLQAYGATTWHIRLEQWADQNAPANITANAVRALGGAHTAFGAEYMRRCALIDTFVYRLVQLRKAALQKYPAQHADLVNEEVHEVLRTALDTLCRGFPYVQKDMEERLHNAISCRIGRRTGGIVQRVWGFFAC